MAPERSGVYYRGSESQAQIGLPFVRHEMSKTSKSRLTTPLVRESGLHRPATWDEALDRVAKGFRTQVEQRGPQTFGMFSCSKTTNELNYVAQKFVRSVIGSNNIDSCNRT